MKEGRKKPITDSSFDICGNMENIRAPENQAVSTTPTNLMKLMKYETLEEKVKLLNQQASFLGHRNVAQAACVPRISKRLKKSEVKGRCETQKLGKIRHQSTCLLSISSILILPTSNNSK